MSKRGEEITSCPCCGAKPHHLYRVKTTTPPLEIMICPECELQFQSHLPADPASHYDADYYSDQGDYHYKDERAKLKYENYVWQARLKNLARFVPPPADLLDVGCSFGGLVEAAQKFGYNARGLDISEYSVTSGKERGLNLSCGELTPETVEANSVDILTMVEVLEHLPEPRSAFAALKKAVRPGGVALIQTANFAGRQARRAAESYHYYLPGHYFYYSIGNLRRLLAEFGFSRIKLYRPVDFGLLPKLMKSRGDFQKFSDYRRWLKISAYHLQSLIAWGDFSWTSSLCIYAFRDK